MHSQDVSRRGNLDHHLVDGKTAATIAKADDASKQKAKTPAEKDADKAAKEAAQKEAADPSRARLEYGSADDFQLKQAMNQLKGLPVIASSKSIAAQVKPQ